jgi:hypothetical protein
MSARVGAKKKRVEKKEKKRVAKVGKRAPAAATATNTSFKARGN